VLLQCDDDDDDDNDDDDDDGDDDTNNHITPSFITPIVQLFFEIVYRTWNDFQRSLKVIGGVILR